RRRSPSRRPPRRGPRARRPTRLPRRAAGSPRRVPRASPSLLLLTCAPMTRSAARRESQLERRRRAGRIVRRLARAYPDARCARPSRNPLELLVATTLSAQCTDKKVNEVTPALFAPYGPPAALAAADPAVVERMIRSTGFYRQKARAIQEAARGV